MATLSGEDKKIFAKNLNEIKNELNLSIENKFKEIESLEINSKLRDEKVDVTLPIRTQKMVKFTPCHK